MTTVKETFSAEYHQQLFAEVEKQYVAVTPPDSPEPPLSMVGHVSSVASLMGHVSNLDVVGVLGSGGFS